MTQKCDGRFHECGKDAVFRVEARSHDEQVKLVCKTHVSWALAHTAYMNGDLAEVRRIKGVS